FLAALFFVAVFLVAVLFFVAVFLVAAFFAGVFLGTLAPASRASDKPIAIACLRLVTFLPERPDFSVPSFISSITLCTFFCALSEYFFAMVSKFLIILSIYKNYAN
ncbi:MAG: hypothetical protein EOP51_02080, partial [Sphingobacteriales bacterium]